MKKSLIIQIPEPCHEDWGKMTPTEKGKHCAVCSKEVVDFTRQSDEAIVKHVLKNKNACGRFTTKQINRELVLERKSTASLAPYAASLLLPLTLLNGQQAHAHGSAPVNEKPMISLGIGSHASTARVRVTISGTVTDIHGNPLQNAEVTVLETSMSTRTDASGYYSITTLNDNTLIFQKGYLDQKDIQIGRKDANIDVILTETSKTVRVTVGKISSVNVPSTKENVEICDLTSEEDIDEVASEAVIEEKPSKAKTITISGTVTDDNNIPLPGVNVIIKGTSTGTQTDFDGNYSMDVVPNKVLRFSYVGFETQEITVANISNNIGITLKPDYNIILGGAIGGIVVVESNFFNSGPSVGYAKPEANQGSPERRAWKKKLKEAHDNEIEFKRIKRERRKKRNQ